MDFFGIGFQELVLILLVLLIVVGPARLPQVANTMGRAIRKVKQATTELSRDFQEMADEVKDTGKEVDDTVRSGTGLTGELREVAKEIKDVEKEVGTALTSDSALTKDFEAVSKESKDVAKEANTTSDPTPEEQVDTGKDESKIQG